MTPEGKQRFIHKKSNEHSIPANEKILWWEDDWKRRKTKN